VKNRVGLGGRVGCTLGFFTTKLKMKEAGWEGGGGWVGCNRSQVVSSMSQLSVLVTLLCTVTGVRVREWVGGWVGGGACLCARTGLPRFFERVGCLNISENSGHTGIC
jgi:hypothetical protein